MTTMVSQITSLTIVYSTVYSSADQRKYQSSASLAFVRESLGTGEFPTQGPVTRKMFPFDDVIMDYGSVRCCSRLQWLHNERDGVSNHQRFDCLLSRFFRRRSEKTSKFRVTEGKNIGDRWIPPAKGQYCGKCSYLMTPSCWIHLVNNSLQDMPVWDRS